MLTKHIMYHGPFFSAIISSTKMYYTIERIGPALMAVLSLDVGTVRIRIPPGACDPSDLGFGSGFRRVL